MALLKDLEQELHDYLADTHALEKSVELHLGALASTTKDRETRAALQDHQALTREQIARLEARLDAHNLGRPRLKDTSRQFTVLVKALNALLRDDKPAQNARDVFVTEHLEIAAYELLERLALRAGDAETARVARQNAAEEAAMASFVAANWDRVIDEVLEEEGWSAQVPERGRYSNMPAAPPT